MQPDLEADTTKYVKKRLILSILRFLEQRFQVPFTEAMFQTLFESINSIYGIDYLNEKVTITETENLDKIYREFIIEQVCIFKSHI